MPAPPAADAWNGSWAGPAAPESRHGPAAPDSRLPASPQYGDWARGQRPQGTVYGGAAPSQDAGPGPTTSPLAIEYTQGMENSGSLTGHILAQGRPDTPDTRPGSSKKVIILMMVIGLLVVGGLVAAIIALSGLLKG
jgi:hypothetical protein